MHKSVHLDSKFAFLADLTKDRATQYRSATWLESDFDEPVWTCKFDGCIFTIDFRVKLDDSLLLTDLRHASLLELFKYWLCIQTHSDVTGTNVSAPSTSYNRIILTLAVIDYFLLNGAQFELSRFGLSALTSSHIKEMLIAFSSAPSVPHAVYQWHTNLSLHLRAMGDTLSSDEFEDVLREAPWIGQIADNVDRVLQLTDEELIKSRAYLWKEGIYSEYALSGYRYHPNSVRLCEKIFSETLWGKKTRIIPDELCLLEISQYQRERQGVPVKNWEDTITQSRFSVYLSILRSLGLLSALNVDVPHRALTVVSDKSFLRSLSLRESKRIRTLPHRVVSGALRHAIEFSLEFGDDLISSYLNLVRAARESKLTSLTYFDEKNGIEEFLSPTIKSLGVKYWNLKRHLLIAENGNAPKTHSLRPLAQEYFARYRRNEGLYELLSVLYGAIQLCVGTVMARRQGELDDLMADDALDSSKSYLVFRNRKTGAIGRRQQLARPIPNVSARLVGMLYRLQEGLIELGVLEKFGNLFAMPHASYVGLRSRVYSGYSLDRFCDYFEVECNSEGKRYYIRQHQLRRHFAMMFFWGSSFGGVETLQWFLGHADPEHLYRYVTESIPGAALTSAKAAYATELLINNDAGASALANLVSQHFGTSSFSVLDYEELEDYIQDLLADDQVNVEPQFYSSGDGRKYRILVTVKGS